MKPLEVEILVAEVAHEAADDQLFHLLYDGTVIDEDRFAVLGGDAEAVSERFGAAYEADADLAGVLRAAVDALAGAERQLVAAELEVALLDRAGSRRCFRRLADDEVSRLIG